MVKTNSDVDAPGARREARPLLQPPDRARRASVSPSMRQAQSQRGLCGFSVGIKGNETCEAFGAEPATQGRWARSRHGDRLRHSGRPWAHVLAPIPGRARTHDGLAPTTGRGREAHPPHEQTWDPTPSRP